MANIPLKTIQFPDLPDTYVVAPPITDTASGSIASFTDGADDLPVADLTVSIVPKQESGTPSPTNVLPISGWTEANIVVSATQDEQDGTTYTVNFGSAGTVYGGSLNATTGKLTVEYKKYICTSVDEVGAVNNSRFAYSHTDKPSDLTTQNYAKAYCDKYQNVMSASARLNGTFCINNGYLLFINDAFTSVSAANTLIASQKPEVVYPLASPVEYTLTQTEVRTLLGVNNIWSDTGDVSVEYVADTKTYIDKKIAEVQALVLES